METGETVQRINWGNMGPLRGSFTPDGRHAVWTGYDAVIRMYRLSSPGREEAVRAEEPTRWPTGEQPALVEVAPFRGHDGAAEIAVVSPDGRRILSGSNDQTMILWNRETGQPIRRFKAHTDRVNAVAISPDGRRALSGGADKVVRLWDLESGDPIHEFRGHTEWVFSVAFSPDGRRAYSTSGGSSDNGWRDGTDSAIRVWDVETARQVGKLEGHKGIVWRVAISPDGRLRPLRRERYVPDPMGCGDRVRDPPPPRTHGQSPMRGLPARWPACRLVRL